MTPSMAKVAPMSRPSTWAVAGGACGLTGAVGALPSGVRAALLLAFVAAGPGSALLQYWAASIPPVAQRALVPVVGLALVVLVVSFALLLGWWSPQATLLGMSALTVAVGVLAVRRERAGR